MLFCKLKQLNG